MQKNRLVHPTNTIMKRLFLSEALRTNERTTSTLYTLGEAHSKSICSLLSSKTISLPRFFEEFAHSYEKAGFGKLQFVELNLCKGTGLVIVQDSLEAKINVSADGSTCHFTRGQIAELLKTITGKTVKVDEIRCLAKGDKYCEFRIT